MQVAIAGPVHDDAGPRIAAVADIFIGLFDPAKIIIVNAALDVPWAREDIVKIWRAEGCAIGGAEEQAVRRAHLQSAIIGKLANVAARKAETVIAASAGDGHEIEQGNAKFAANRGVAPLAFTVAVLPAVIIVGERERIGAEVITLLAIFSDRREADRSGGELEQFAVGQRRLQIVGPAVRTIDGVGRNAVIFCGCEGAVQLGGRVGVVDRITTILVDPEPGAEEKVLRLLIDDLRPADDRLIATVVERRFIVPAIAEIAADTGRNAVRRLLDALHLEAAGFLRGELARPIVDRVVECVVETVVGTRRAVFECPAGNIVHQANLADAELEIGEQLGVVGQLVGHRAKAVETFASRNDRAVADRFLAAAIIAGAIVVEVNIEVAVARPRGVNGRTTVEIGEPCAGRRAGVDIGVVLDAVTQEGPPRDRADRAVVGAVLNRALIRP